ncbi:MAG: hypothetical protein QOF43_1824 [Gaiellaceae bacterium]|nr:hypothetical protein [Gaiellaceae bacterium]
MAETAIIYQCVRLGIGVSRPLDDERYDLILDLHPQLIRVQCKWAVQHGDVVVVRLYSNRRGPSGMITKRYSSSEVDAFAAYCESTDRCYYLPCSFARFREVRFRLGPTKNNQSARVRWAKDYELGATLLEAWGRSSAGRASGWQPEGQGFEPPRLHS